MLRKVSQWLSAPEFLRRYPLVSKNTFYADIKRGNIPHIKLGRKIFIPSDAFEQMMENAAEDEGDAAIVNIRSA